ncbi:MAG: glycosyltransferase [Phycisphaerales bacterium]|nr:glycosyltransferase [Phycisphaerales bacterium]MCI0629911.1 glycosyltransferase [Phycisphaerales bacterium]MCI0677148.1 glycosyltransferase [Phycisphaerales bacterium]
MTALTLQPRPNQASELVVIPAMTAAQGSFGSFILTRKFLDGVLEYSTRWPGKITVHIERADHSDSNLDHVEVHPSELAFGLHWLETESIGAEAMLRDARLVLATLVDNNVWWARHCRRFGIPLVYISEYNVRTRRQIIRAQTANPLLRWRRDLWTTQLEKQFESAVSIATGIQCNGTPTYDAYGRLNQRALLYFDTRMRAEQYASQATLALRFSELLAGAPLRLAFSGRLIAMKGADHLPLIAAELRNLDVPFTMDICGGGALEHKVRRMIEQLGLSHCVTVRGVLDFQTELVPFIARHVDLFICPHPQGDPSCSYLETMSCGTPIIGYDNDALRGLVNVSGAGWHTPLNNPGALALRIAELNLQRPELVSMGLASLAFARRHTFEKTMQARIDHMLACSAQSAMEAQAV